MANLIITVIAIALVAVASLMGAYYGGSAFLNNQSAANASTVMNEGQQLAGAWQSYLSENQNTAPIQLTGTGVNPGLVSTNQIASVPHAPAAPGSVAETPVDVQLVGTHYYMWADMGKPGANGASLTDSNATACLRIIKTATGTAPATNALFVAPLAPGAIAASATKGNNTFGCSITNAAAPAGLTGSGTAPASGDYVAEYLLQ